MAMEIGVGVNDFDDKEINAMAIEMVEVINLATQMGWCALMKDQLGIERTSAELEATVKTIADKSLL
jgi:hypothetical protein